MKRVYVDIEELSVEDVSYEASQIYGSFGAIHAEPEPVTPMDLVVIAEWEGRMTTKNREQINRWKESRVLVHRWREGFYRP